MHDIRHGQVYDFQDLALVADMFKFSRLVLARLAKQKRSEEYLEYALACDHLISVMNEPSLSGLERNTHFDETFTRAVSASLAYIDDPAVIETLLAGLHHQMLSSSKLELAMQGEAVVKGLWAASVSPADYWAANRLDFTKLKSIGFMLGRPGVLRRRNMLLAYMLDTLDAFKEPWPANYDRSQMQDEQYLSCSDSLFHFPAEVYHNATYRLVSMQVHRELLFAVLHVHLFKLKNGRLPVSLDEVEPYKTSGIPVDSYAGHPLLYKGNDSPLYFRIKVVCKDGTISADFYEPDADMDFKGRYNQEGFGRTREGETILGVGYYVRDYAPLPPEKLQQRVGRSSVSSSSRSSGKPAPASTP